MGLKHKLLSLAVGCYSSLYKILPKVLGERLASETSEVLPPISKIETKYGTLKLYSFGRVPLFRAITFHSKEPETLEWIDGMKSGETLWDIGANVGIYSAYAGLKGMKVCAFEPSALNTFLLAKNICINSLGKNVLFYCLAVADKNEFGFLNMTSHEAGGAFSEFAAKDVELKSLNQNGCEVEVISQQAMFSYSIDELVEKYSFEIPNHIKIDVDSIEEKIILGADKTLFSPVVKSLLVELDENDPATARIEAFLKERGFSLSAKKHSELIQKSKFNTGYNYIFTKG